MRIDLAQITPGAVFLWAVVAFAISMMILVIVTAILVIVGAF